MKSVGVGSLVFEYLLCKSNCTSMLSVYTYYKQWNQRRFLARISGEVVK